MPMIQTLGEQDADTWEQRCMRAPVASVLGKRSLL
jgi:hypothetical protein